MTMPLSHSPFLASRARLSAPQSSNETDPVRLRQIPELLGSSTRLRGVGERGHKFDEQLTACVYADGVRELPL